jgi:hypothetical protein
MAITQSITSGKWTVKSPRGIHIFLLLKFFYLELQEDLQKIQHMQLNGLCNYMNIINLTVLLDKVCWEIMYRKGESCQLLCKNIYL